MEEEVLPDVGRTQAAVTADNGLAFNGTLGNGIQLNGFSLNGLAYNGLTSNGLSLNGIYFNGLSLNGIYFNGISYNGIYFNGVYFNGLSFNGLSFNGVYFNGVYFNGLSYNGLHLNGLSLNGLAYNGIYFNGLANNGVYFNGLNLNGLALNGLALNGIYFNGAPLGDQQDLDTVDGMIYALVGCALPEGDSATLTWPDGTVKTYDGVMGLAPEWKDGPLSLEGNEKVAGCVAAAFENGGTSGVETQIALNDAETAQVKTLLSYMISCALPDGDSVTIDGDLYEGSLGLAPEWKSSSPTVAGEELVSACLLARVNADGSRVSISLRAPELTCSAEEIRSYKHHEGAFMGDLFGVTPWAKTCSGKDGVWTAGRRCTDGSCGFEDLGPCQSVCLAYDSVLGHDDCGPSYAYKNVINTFLYSSVDYATPNDFETYYGSGQLIETVDLDHDGKLDLVTDMGAALGDGTGKFETWIPFDYDGQLHWGESMALGDIDGDGFLDAVVSNGSVYRIMRLLMGAPGGTFAPATYLGSGQGVAMADLDGDGRAEIVSTQYAGGSGIVVRDHKRNGTFTETFYPGGQDPTFVAVGDLNDDGKPDILTANEVSWDLSLYFGRGNGAFDDEVRITQVSGASGLWIMDIDQDGHNDIVTQAGGLNALLGDGTGSFVQSSSISAPSGIKDLHLTDLTGDGNDDVVLSAASSVNSVGGVMVLPGHGDGTYDDPRSAGFFYAGPIATGDFDGDGAIDVAAPAFTVGLNNGDGTFGGTGIPVGPYPMTIEAADLNGDGFTDLISASDQSLSVILANADGTFAPETRYYSSSVRSDVEVVDVNNDGVLDVVTAAYDTGLGVWLGDGNGAFASRRALTYRGAIDAEVADIDGDGVRDIVATVAKATATYPDQPYVIAWHGLGDGTFEWRGQIALWNVCINPVGQGGMLAARDVNSDGFADLVTSGCGTVEVSLGHGDGTFDAIVEHPVKGCSGPGAQSGRLEVADLDDDGALDILTACNRQLSILFGDGNGSFPRQSRYDFTGDGGPGRLTVADLDGDGALDVVVPMHYQSLPDYGSLNVLLGNGAGTFSIGLHFQLPYGPTDTAAFELDGDGVLELATARRNKPDVVILRTRRPSDCGDGVCGSNEDCSVCAADCGECPVCTPTGGECSSDAECCDGLSCSKDRGRWSCN